MQRLVGCVECQARRGVSVTAGTPLRKQSQKYYLVMIVMGAWMKEAMEKVLMAWKGPLSWMRMMGRSSR